MPWGFNSYKQCCEQYPCTDSLWIWAKISLDSIPGVLFLSQKANEDWISKVISDNVFEHLYLLSFLWVVLEDLSHFHMLNLGVIQFLKLFNSDGYNLTYSKANEWV